MRRSYESTEARTGSRETRLIIDVCTKQNTALLHIYSLIDLNQTDTLWVLTHAGTSRKPSASYITDQRETRLMSVRAQSKQRLHNQGLMVVLKLVVDYSNAKFRSTKVIK